MSDNSEWFAPKRYGYGAGVPISWQGWAVTILFIVLIGAATFLLRRNELAYISTVATLIAIFTIVSAKTTRGGWRWRWGEDD